MKTVLLMTVALALAGCDEKESLIRKEAIEETARNMGKNEKERFLNDSLPLALKHVEICRKRLRLASTPNELALAEDDLRGARRELNKIERDLEELDR